MIATAIYGVLTLCAVGLSFRKGGPIAVVGGLIGAFWFLQVGLMVLAEPRAWNVASMVCDMTLVLVVGVLVGLRPRLDLGIIIAAILAQLALAVAFRQKFVADEVFRLTLNALYVAQLAALAWPERK